MVSLQGDDKYLKRYLYLPMLQHYKMHACMIPEHGTSEIYNALLRLSISINLMYVKSPQKGKWELYN